MKRLRDWRRGRRLQKAARILGQYAVRLCHRCDSNQFQNHRPCFVPGCQCRCSY